MAGNNKDEALLMSLNLFLDEEKFEDFASRWQQELCPIIVFYRFVQVLLNAVLRFFRSFFLNDITILAGHGKF